MNKKIITFIAIISLLLAYTSNCIAASISELNEQKEQAQNEKDQVTEQRQNAESELDTINAQISSIEAEIFSLQNQLDELNSSITQKEQEIEEKQAELDHKEDLLKTRMVAMYKGGGTTYLDVLLGSSNYIEMYTKYNAIQTIAEKDTELINEVSQQKADIENQKQELENNKAQVESVKSETDAKNAELKAAKVAKQSTISQLSAEEQALQQKIEEFEQAIEKAQQEIADATQGAGGYEGAFTGGRFEWPLSYSYNRITSIFGNRTAPTAGASTNHGAIDIGVSYVPVYAPANGKVILAQWVSGYGNYIMIDHGSGYYTAFGHLSQFTVSVGTVVSTGQQIAVSGNTVISTGPHLHYEVYVGGRSKGYRVDPLQWTNHPSLIYS